MCKIVVHLTLWVLLRRGRDSTGKLTKNKVAIYILRVTILWNNLSLFLLNKQHYFNYLFKSFRMKSL